jgi:hypothetical protein
MIYQIILFYVLWLKIFLAIPGLFNHTVLFYILDIMTASKLADVINFLKFRIFRIILIERRTK